MRSIEEIYQAMLETISERSGFSPAEDCDLAVRLYAAAAQVQALELQATGYWTRAFLRRLRESIWRGMQPCGD